MTKSALSQPLLRACTVRALVMCLVLMPVGAAAGAWDDFEEHCLLPMEAAEPVDITEFQGSTGDDGTGLFNLETENVKLFVVNWTTTWTGHNCHALVLNDEDVSDARADFIEWRSRMLGSGRYAYSETAIPHWTTTDQTHLDGRWLYSVGFREPKLRVGIMDMPGNFTFMVEDTNLES